MKCNVSTFDEEGRCLFYTKRVEPYWGNLIGGNKMSCFDTGGKLLKVVSGCVAASMDLFEARADLIEPAVLNCMRGDRTFQRDWEQ